MCENCAKRKKSEALSKKHYKKDAIAHKDLSGKQFGLWTVLGKGEYTNGMQMWVCKCKCGTTKEVSPYILTNGTSTSCGCSASYNLIGKRIGMLKVIGITKENRLSCICQCDCGNVIRCTASDLSWKRSCGCFSKIENEKHAKISNVLRGGQKIRKNNTSGITGVHRANGKWGAAIKFQEKEYWLGTFDNIDDAARARKEAERHLYGDFLDWFYATHPKKNSKSCN